MATITYGAIIVPILQDFSPNDVHHIVNHSESTFLFTSDNIWDNLEEEKLTGLRGVFSLTDFRCLYQRDGETIQKFLKNLDKEMHSSYPQGFSRENIQLFAGRLYHSRSVLFLPGYFDELEHRYPTEFAGVFEAFAESWHEEATSAICHTLRRINEERARTVGGHVYMQGIVETMVAELACSRAAHKQARQAADTRASVTIAEEATAMIERALDKGRRVGINEVAERLYTSRSKLCATFKAQTGESLGAYIRRRRMERAQDLLADSALTIAQVAERLGYPQQAAFAQAFKQHTGTTPTTWRSQHQ